MEDNKSGIIHVRIPLDKVEELEKLSIRYGLNRSRLIKFALQRFMNMVEETPLSKQKELTREIQRISEQWKAPRPQHYRPRQSKGLMLVNENETPYTSSKTKGRNKKEK